LPEALRRFDEADVALAEAGVPLAEFDLDRLQALVTMRIPDEATGLGDRLVTALRAQGDHLLLGQALLRLADARSLAGDDAGAGDAAAEARVLFTRQRRPAWAALATTAEARARLADGTASVGELRRCRPRRLSLRLHQRRQWQLDLLVRRHHEGQDDDQRGEQQPRPEQGGVLHR
jgi:hypothetical protein